MTNFDTPVGCECGECKRCKNRIKAQRWREKNRERTKQYYIDNKDRINEVNREWKSNNSDRIRESRREYDKEYRSRPNVKKADYHRRQKPENQKKIDARYKLRNAVRYGKIERKPCEVCGEINSHGHHEDYDKPYDVIWLCAKHHAEVHRMK